MCQSDRYFVLSALNLQARSMTLRPAPVPWSARCGAMCGATGARSCSATHGRRVKAPAVQDTWDTPHKQAHKLHAPPSRVLAPSPHSSNPVPTNMRHHVRLYVHAPTHWRPLLAPAASPLVIIALRRGPRMQAAACRRAQGRRVAPLGRRIHDMPVPP